MTEPPLEPGSARRRLLLALGVTAVAVPILLFDNFRDGDGEDDTITTLRVVAPSMAPDDRPETGPPKGISVVTSSTTSSTEPITITTTTVVG